jgi:hypothetical protein
MSREASWLEGGVGARPGGTALLAEVIQAVLVVWETVIAGASASRTWKRCQWSSFVFRKVTMDRFGTDQLLYWRKMQPI